MELILDLFRDTMSPEEQQELIVFLVLNYNEQVSHAVMYKHWPNKLKSDASERLKELFKKYGRTDELRNMFDQKDS